MLIVSRKRAPTIVASPPPDSDNESSEKIFKTEPVDSPLFLDLSPPNKGKKFTTTAISVSSDEEEIEAMTPTPKAKSAKLVNRKAASTPSKTKPYVLICSVSFLCLIYVFFRSLSKSYREDQHEPGVKSSVKSPSPSPSSLGYAPFIYYSVLAQIMLLHFRNSLVIVPAKEDMRAEYCPLTLLVDGCPMELGPGAFEFFDKKINKYVCRNYLNPQTLM